MYALTKATERCCSCRNSPRTALDHRSVCLRQKPLKCVYRSLSQHRDANSPLRLIVVRNALPALDVDTATVVSALKGPTLSELVSYTQYALSLAGSAWGAAIAPFAIFGTDRWGLNIFFYFAVLIMGFNLIIQAPKQ